MSDAQQQAPLQFETAGGPANAACSACRQPIASTYYTVGAQVACERCKAQIELALKQSPGLDGVLRGVLLGSIAGLVGAAAWYGIRVFAGLEIGLIAIAIGYFVGLGVKRGSGGRGGLSLQLLAVALTYFWIAANYVPDVLAGMNEAPSVASLALAVATSLALPFLMGFENAIGILIIGFGLYQAWVLNKGVSIQVAGPFSIAPANAPSARV